MMQLFVASCKKAQAVAMTAHGEPIPFIMADVQTQPPKQKDSVRVTSLVTRSLPPSQLSSA